MTHTSSQAFTGADGAWNGSGSLRCSDSVWPVVSRFEASCMDADVLSWGTFKATIRQSEWADGGR